MVKFNVLQQRRKPHQIINKVNVCTEETPQRSVKQQQQHRTSHKNNPSTFYVSAGSYHNNNVSNSSAENYVKPDMKRHVYNLAATTE